MWQQRIWLIYLLFGLSINAEYSKPEWWWSYTCKNGRCIRNNDPNVSSVPNITNFLSVCRMTCGQYGSLWPRPTGHTALSHKIVPIRLQLIDFNLNITGSTEANNYVVSSTKIFLNNLSLKCNGDCTIFADGELMISIKTLSPDLSLNWRTDEGYSVEIISRGNHVYAEIDATTVYGARHGLETLSQLITGFEVNGKYGLVIVSGAKVSDKPVYPHRGLLIDTSRNFLPVKTIKRTIDGMAASKLNVLHWHITDSHSFPLESPRIPQLTRYGAYSAKEVYHTSDVTDLLGYANQRGVQIILELDGPAHAGYGWQWGPEFNLGELAVCVNQQPWREYCIQPPCGQLNPANPNLFKIMRELFKDIIDLFPPNRVLHMGGDEVYFPCWNATPEITNWMQSQGLGRSVEDFLYVWGVYQEKLLKLWDEQVGHARTPIILWSSHLTDPAIIEKYLDKDRYIIETWVEKDNDLPHELLRRGYKVIFATKDAWYLDHGFWKQTVYHKWTTVYDNKIRNEQLGVLGGEACMWGEYADEYNVDTKIWPRAAAMAERVWSNPNTTSSAAQYRMFEQRERLVQIGIDAEAITPEWCYLNEGECEGI